MPKVGNYVQRDYHNKFRSQRKSTWSDYNKAWAKRRQASTQKMQELRNLASNFTNIGVQASQANTVFLMQNQGQGTAYASPTAVMSRINVIV
ncbi:flagellar biosynthesis protein [Roseibium porphyridii]|uniref:Flagellar biosynthesis protein n=1 Tax=Roseibium porphyridii TaxID=2866279 RepID=A0ABY8F9E8_9HYPH|nr:MULTISPECIES: flagellar biosynthesis protein [Stappiaceae]QFT30725.1 hypothetical protein FIV00_09580 [Labrenzia sp. THAF82]WFE91354.1 flagellar biosynthesis protein [Roseibium sp. KMA01]